MSTSEITSNPELSKIWEIAQFVENHPDDLDQRWRLAKKLYMAWEYRLALEHLQVLRNEWRPKLNVWRYLAATYFRLGRYDDAVAELEAAIKEWPEELGLREQLARVLETADRRLDAATVWGEIKKLDPSHPIASSAVKRLRAPEKKKVAPTEDLHLGDSDSGIDLRPGRVCPNCGAQNSDDFDRCWQCHAALSLHNLKPGTPAPKKRVLRFTLSPEALALSIGMVAAGFLTFGVYLTLRYLLASKGQDALASGEMLDVVNATLGATRLGIGLCMLVLWPLALWIGLRLAAPEESVPASLVSLSGVLLASLAYTCAWLPVPMAAVTIVIPTLVSLAIVVLAFRLRFAQAVAVWAIQLLLAALFTLGAFVGIEYYRLEAVFNPLTEIPASAGHLMRMEGGSASTEYHFQDTVAPFEQRGVRWGSTGSSWLDHQVGDILFTVTGCGTDAQMKFELRDKSGTLIFDPVTRDPWTITYRVAPGETYDILVSGPEGANVQVKAAGMLQPVIATPKSTDQEATPAA